jgi:hypothetical protein
MMIFIFRRAFSQHVISYIHNPNHFFLPRLLCAPLLRQENSMISMHVETEINSQLAAHYSNRRK